MIPTVSWGNENTFEFCFLGIPKGSTVAVSTYVVSEHDNRCDQKEFFMKGYREMLRRIEPERIICYNTPFPEMEGNIAFVDYELSSWKYQEKEYEPSPYSKYITGELLLPENSGIIINEVMWNLLEKVWAAHTVESGGQIRISRRIKDISEIQVRSKQQSCQTEMERHETNHGRGDKHTDPHDHEIGWDEMDGHPMPGPPINYPDEAPEFKQYRRMTAMSDTIIVPDGSLNFETISEFKRSISWGAEIEFEWNGITYGVVRYGTDNKITIFIANRPETEKVCETADEALEYMVGEDRLRDVITQVRVVARSN